jgi:hypothetical protein
MIQSDENICTFCNFARYDDLPIAALIPSDRNGVDTDLFKKCNTEERKLCFIKEYPVYLHKYTSMWNYHKRMIERTNGALHLHTRDFDMFLLSPNTEFVKSRLNFHLKNSELMTSLVGVLLPGKK